MCKSLRVSEAMYYLLYSGGLRSPCRQLKAANRYLVIMLILIGALILGYGSTPAPAGAQGPVTEHAISSAIMVNHQQMISGHLDNLPLDRVLLMMSGKNLFAIKGVLPVGETVSATLVDVSLENALGKILRGYNYVLVKQESDRKPFLMLIGRAVRSRAVASAVQPTFAVQRSNRVPDTRVRYMLPAAMNRHRLTPGDPHGALSKGVPTVREAANASLTEQARASSQNAGTNAPAPRTETGLQPN